MTCLLQCGEHHPASVRRNRHRRLIDEGHFFGGPTSNRTVCWTPLFAREPRRHACTAAITTAAATAGHSHLGRRAGGDAAIPLLLLMLAEALLGQRDRSTPGSA